MTTLKDTMPTLVDIQNAEEIAVKIHNAAQAITVMYRATGRRLNPTALDVPLLEETEQKLQRLVDNAIAAMNAIAEVAPKHAEQITGTHEDGLFEAVVYDERGLLQLELYHKIA